MTSVPDFSFESAAQARGYDAVAGVDEAGRGPLAGPVTAAAVILHANDIPDGLNDSKKLTKRQREALYAQITRRARAWSVAHASVDEIDEINILRASHLAMTRALKGLERVDLGLIDGNMVPRDMPCEGQAIIKGDARSLSIAAASIVAKICRDRVMYDLAQHHPGYGWETNQGYPSKSHISALQNLGVTPHHRRSFKPVHQMLWQGK